MNLKDIVSISGKPGLYKVINQANRGYIVEQINGDGKKIMTKPTDRIAGLHDITLYTDSGDALLRDVFKEMDKNADKIPTDLKNGEALKEFFATVLPNYDRERVYTSDMKKVIKWHEEVKELPEYAEPDPEEDADEKE